MSASWLRIEEEDGTSVIIVRDDHLSNFPNFMSSVIQNKIGLDRGYFKIRFDSSTIPRNNMSDIIKFLRSYYTCKEPKTKQIPKPDCQTFYSTTSHEDVYGFRVNISQRFNPKILSSSVSNFIQAASNPTTFLSQNNCCLDALTAGGTEQLSAHYWSYVRENAISTAPYLAQGRLEQLLHEGRQHAERYAGSHQENFLKQQLIPSSLTQATPVTEKITKQNSPLLYGSSIPLPNTSFPISVNFNLSQLGTILDLNPDLIPGVSYPYLYLGTAHASFPYHIEDGVLFSINYLHFEAPCVWFIVPPQYYKKFVDLAHHFKLDLGQVSCNNVLGHKYVMASEEFLSGLGVPVNTVVQKQNEFIVTYPFTPHSGFKCGFNVQQASNFGDVWWVEPALLAPSCTCFQTQVKLNLTHIIATAEPHLLNLYLSNDTRQLMNELSTNEFIKKLGLLPQDFIENVCSSTSREKESNQKAVSTSLKSATKCNVARRQLRCPDVSCRKTWAGGIGRMERVVLHIKKYHEDSAVLCQRLHEMYPPKDKTKSIQCSICSEWLAGNQFHLKRHMKTVHS